MTQSNTRFGLCSSSGRRCGCLSEDISAMPDRITVGDVLLMPVKGIVFGAILVAALWTSLFWRLD